MLRNSQSYIDNIETGRTVKIEMIKMDDLLRAIKLDILKIDVEGFEEFVLKGSEEILSNLSRGPRIIYIEVHPFAWERYGTTFDSLLELLESKNYNVTALNLNEIKSITHLGQIFAEKRN